MSKHLGAGAYLVVWLALLGLTALSFTTSTLDLGWFDAPLMLGIAVIKALLVVAVFMHLIEARFASRMVILVTALFVVILVGLTAADVATRKTFPAAVQGRTAAPAPAPHH